MSDVKEYPHHKPPDDRVVLVEVLPINMVFGVLYFEPTRLQVSRHYGEHLVAEGKARWPSIRRGTI